MDMHIPNIVDNNKEKYGAPLHMNGQQEREEEEGDWGRGTSRGVGLMHMVGCYVGFGWNTGGDCRSWSHICGSWYLPMLQIEGGSCTWINMASFMVLD